MLTADMEDKKTSQALGLAPDQGTSAKTPMMQTMQPTAPPVQNPPVWQPPTSGVMFGAASEPTDEADYAHRNSGCCFTCIPTGSIGLMMRTGSFEGIIEPGRAHYCLGWSEIKIVPLALQSVMFRSDCKTKDNTLVTIVTALQYSIMRQKIRTAVFDTINPIENMNAQVDSVLRTTIPALELDAVYAAKHRIVADILAAIREPMQARGYNIHKVLITDVQPDPNIVRTMNNLNAERRYRDAAFDKGEADKIMQIMAAEAEAEAMQKSGAGLREMRKAMADGFTESVQELAGSGSGYSIDKAMHVMMAAQYLDTLKEFADSGKASIIVPSGPGGIKEIERQVADGFLSAGASSSEA